MASKSFVIFVGTLFVLFVTSFLGLYLYDDDFRTVASGNAIKDKIIGVYESSSVENKFLILFQFFVGIVAIALIIFVIKSIQKKRMFMKKDLEKYNTGKSRTDLDVLYDILKDKKAVDLSDIENVFKVDSEIAFGWAKILENGDLAIIDYPRFGKPILRLIEDEEETTIKEVKLEKKIKKIPKKKEGDDKYRAKVIKAVGQGDIIHKNPARKNLKKKNSPVVHSKLPHDAKNSKFKKPDAKKIKKTTKTELKNTKVKPKHSKLKNSKVKKVRKK